MFKELLKQIYQHQKASQSNEVYEALLRAVTAGSTHAYFFENFHEVREIARSEGLEYENLEPTDTECDVRCIKVWGWVDIK
jgi:hypothetical protein